MDERMIRAVERDGLGRRTKDILILCYDRILDGEIRTVEELLAYLGDLGWDPRLEKIIRRSYRLIRSLHWGIFRELDPRIHPDLWKALTVTNRTMPEIADIKRNVIVPNVFCGLVDIHDYTEFCRKNRHNVSMLRTLDDLIARDMRELAERNACLATRSAGDMIIVIGSSATDLMATCLGIIATFSRRRIMQAAATTETRRGRSIVMQDFNVSAGIAGGQHYNSLVVTQDGDISGTAVNTAARLQGFAGTVDPGGSKVMISSHVHASYQKERSRRSRNADRRDAEYLFFDCGRIGFKGVSAGVFELLFAEREMKRVRYQDAYSRVLEATRNGLWSEQLVPLVTSLVSQVLEVNPISRVEVRIDGQARSFSTDQIIALCDDAVARYEAAEDHREISIRLQQIASVLDASSGFDALARVYFARIVSAYDQMVREFEAVQNEKILENQIGLFSKRERSVIDHAIRLERIRDALIERGKRENSIYSSAMLWHKIVSDFQDGLDFDLYAGKR